MQHRIEEIRRLTVFCSWRHCPGELNPVDLPSRGVGVRDLVKAKLWWNGPQFSYSSKEEWPHTFCSEFSKQACTELVKHPEVTYSLLTMDGATRYLGICKVVEAKNCRSFNLLLRVTACVLRFVDNSKRGIAISKRGVTPFILKAEELQ